MFPEDIVNRSIDAVSPGIIIGSIEGDGTFESEMARRVYGPTLRQLLRAANWSWARRRAPLQLLADATGLTPTVPTYVERPWRYAYAWPIDGVRMRWMPWSGETASQLAPPGFAAVPGQIQLPGAAQTMVPNLDALNPSLYPMERPARFLVSSSDQYPVQVGAPPDFESVPELEGIEGVGPINRRIILTNVQFAQAVYTYLALEIEIWDELFAQAMVAILASYFAVPLIAGRTPDPKLMPIAINARNTQIAIAKDAIREARISSAQEAGWPQSIDSTPDWIRIRRSGPALWNFYGPGSGPGITSMGWESFAFVDGSVF